MSLIRYMISTGCLCNEHWQLFRDGDMLRLSQLPHHCMESALPYTISRVETVIEAEITTPYSCHSRGMGQSGLCDPCWCFRYLYKTNTSLFTILPTSNKTTVWQHYWQSWLIWTCFLFFSWCSLLEMCISFTINNTAQYVNFSNNDAIQIVFAMQGIFFFGTESYDRF